jgi:hypothetical protein
MANCWEYQGVLKRKDALQLAHYWTEMRHSVRIEHTGRRKLFHVWLKITRREP